MLRLGQSNSAPRPRTLPKRSERPLRAAAGFSLIELLLVVGLIMLLAGAMVFNFSSLLHGNHLEEGTTRLETLMRFARAQAANSGRKVQIVFGGEATNAPAASTSEVRATWEPDPLGQPGCYSDMAEAQWHVQEINDLVQVESVKLIDDTAADPVANACPDDSDLDSTNSVTAKLMAPITFYPDGSSDSAEIIVTPRSTEEDDQRMSVRLVGITGSISHQLLSADVEEAAGQVGMPDRLVPRRDVSSRNPSTDRDVFSQQLSTRAATSAPRLASATPHTPVGETNSVDRGD
jgi:Tfp pilus assembly protein FimT